jgi:branched-subunit amino acid aminotransferase/4-amino-4-deoxychorismate lyase
MAQSCSRMMMPQFPEDRFVDAVVQTVRANAAYVPPYGSGASLYIRPFMFGSDAVIGVTVEMETAVKRLCARDHRNEEELRARLRSQHDGAFFKEHCDHVLENNADEAALAMALEGILEKIYIYR